VRILFSLILTGGLGIAALATVPVAAQEGNALVYADFETITGNRPVSARGGLLQLIAYQENDVRKSTFKGLEGIEPPAPELVHLKADDPNHLMKFDFAIQAPNQYAGVGVEIHGLPDKDGKPVGEDVSAYKTLSLQVFAKGVPILRLEANSRGQGIAMQAGWPMMTFKVREGLSTYKAPVKVFTQPSWVQDRIDPKDVFKKLTSLTLTAFCDQCTPMQGMIVVDNVVFEK
jgi:hypothetical protein